MLKASVGNLLKSATALYPDQPATTGPQSTAKAQRAENGRNLDTSSLFSAPLEVFATTRSGSYAITESRSRRPRASASANQTMYTQYRFQPESGARVVPDSWIDSGVHREMGGGKESYYAILVIPGHRLRYEVDERTDEVINGPLGEETVLRTLYVRRDGAGAFEWDTPAIVDTSGENTSYRPREFVAVMARASDAGDPVPQQRQQQYRELLAELHDLAVKEGEVVA